MARTRADCDAPLRVLAVVAALSFALAGPASAERKAQAKYNVDHWGVDQGLLHENVGSVIQTRDGYLWIGTDGGLARFDGVKFVVHRTHMTPGLVGDSVRSLFEDSTGVLWIGTNRGVSRWVDGRFEAVIDKQTSHSIYEICEDRAKNIWIANQSGLLKYSQGSFNPVADQVLPAGRPISSAYCDSKGRVWLGLFEYVGLICIEDGRITAVDHGGAITAFVTAIQETPDGAIWLGTNGGAVVRLKDGTYTPFDAAAGLTGRYVTELYTDARGSLWIAALGLHRFDPDTQRIEQVVPLPTPSIRHVWCDHEGSIWAATYGDGLLRVRPARYKILNAESGLPGDLVRTVMQDASGAMWLGQGGHGAVKIAPDGTTTRLLTNELEGRTDEALTMIVARTGKTFVGAQSSFFIGDGQSVQSHLEQRRSRALFEDSRGRVWIGAYEAGVMFWENGVFSRLPMDAKHGKVTPCGFAEGADGAIWAATMSSGVLRIKDGAVTVYTTADGLPSNESRVVYFDVEGHLWVGTKRGPVILKNGKWHTHPWMSELIDQYVTGIVDIPDDYLLLGTSRGIVRFHRREILDAVFNAQIPDRLRQVVIAEASRTGNVGAACFPGFWKTASGEVWFAARKGAVVIDPRKIRPDTHIPPLRIEQLRADGINHAGRSQIELAGSTRQLTIDYTALTFVQPNRVFFKYRLDGYEEDWVDAGSRRSAFYNNLPPGNYTFHVMACNSDGVWNERGVALSFTVLPLFYQTWWFRLASLAAVTGLVVAFMRWRIRQVQRHAIELQRQNAELERRIAERTAELARSFEALKVSESFYHSLVENLPQIIVRKDTESRFTYANSAFAELVGRPLAEITGRTDDDFYPPDIATKHRADDRRIMESRKTMEYESVVEKDGVKRYHHVKKVPIYSPQNEPMGVQVLYWDVTAFRETEQKLREAQSELMETSRLAGMAEIATGVLHNIGNALNSVNISATAAAERITSLKIPSLSRAVQMILDQKEKLPEFIAHDPRGKQMPAFLAQLADSLTSGREGALEELQALRTGVEHIKEIVAAQQSYAHVSGLTEVVATEELIGSALRIAEASLVRHRVEITKDFAAVPPLKVQRQKALQILVNLINNAKDSMTESGCAEPRLVLRVRRSEDGGIQIDVTDNGVGIAPANLTRIFGFGFTTKRDGHGFGLHSSALAAREMNGSLTVTSEGVGKGATFTLRLPASAVEGATPELTAAH